MISLLKKLSRLAQQLTEQRFRLQTEPNSSGMAVIEDRLAGRFKIRIDSEERFDRLQALIVLAGNRYITTGVPSERC